MTENFSQGASQTISGCDRVVTSIKYEGPWEDDRGGAFLRQLEKLSETLHMNFRPNGILQLFNYPPTCLTRLYLKKRTCFHLQLKINL